MNTVRSHMRKYRKGFTLAELLVTMLLFTMFSTTLLGVLTLSLRYLARADRLISAQKSASMTMDFISNELKNAVINPTSTGYLSISPIPATATAVLVPTPTTSTASEIRFTTVNPDSRNPAMSTYRATCDPSSTSYSTTDRANYQTVRYYIAVNGREVHRELKKYDANGLLTRTTDDVVAQVDEGLITMSFTISQSDLVTITITCRAGTGQDSETFSSTSKIFISAIL